MLCADTRFGCNARLEWRISPFYFSFLRCHRSCFAKGARVHAISSSDDQVHTADVLALLSVSNGLQGTDLVRQTPFTFSWPSPNKSDTSQNPTELSDRFCEEAVSLGHSNSRYSSQ
jgi:hypothetical protein